MSHARSPCPAERRRVSARLPNTGSCSRYVSVVWVVSSICVEEGGERGGARISARRSGKERRARARIAASWVERAVRTSGTSSERTLAIAASYRGVREVRAL